jgi:hypothetical protein
MDYFAGLDISMDETHVCVLDREGVVHRRSREVGRSAMNRNFLELAGQRFGRWAVLSPHSERGGWGGLRWNCVCNCGTERLRAPGTARPPRTNLSFPIVTVLSISTIEAGLRPQPFCGAVQVRFDLPVGLAAERSDIFCRIDHETSDVGSRGVHRPWKENGAQPDNGKCRKLRAHWFFLQIIDQISGYWVSYRRAIVPAFCEPVRPISASQRARTMILALPRAPIRASCARRAFVWDMIKPPNQVGNAGNYLAFDSPDRVVMPARLIPGVGQGAVHAFT